MEKQGKPQEGGTVKKRKSANSEGQKYELNGKEFHDPDGKHYENVIREHMKRIKKGGE